MEAPIMHRLSRGSDGHCSQQLARAGCLPAYLTTSSSVPISAFPRFDGSPSLSVGAERRAAGGLEKTRASLEQDPAPPSPSSEWKPKTPPAALVAFLDGLLQIVAPAPAAASDPNRKASLESPSPLESAGASESADGRERGPCCAATDEDFFRGEDRGDSAENSISSGKGGDSHSSAFTFRGPPSSSDLPHDKDDFAAAASPSALPQRPTAVLPPVSTKRGENFFAPREQPPTLVLQRPIRSFPPQLDGTRARGGISLPKASLLPSQSLHAQPTQRQSEGAALEGLCGRRVVGPAKTESRQTDLRGGAFVSGKSGHESGRGLREREGTAFRRKGEAAPCESSPAAVASQLMRWIGERLEQLEAHLREAALRQAEERARRQKAAERKGLSFALDVRASLADLPHNCQGPSQLDAADSERKASASVLKGGGGLNASEDFDQGRHWKAPEDAAFVKKREEPFFEDAARDSKGPPCHLVQTDQPLPVEIQDPDLAKVEKCLNMALLREALPRIELIQAPSIQPAVVVRQGVAPVVRIFTSSPVAFANAFPSWRENSQDGGQNSGEARAERKEESSLHTATPSVVIHKRAAAADEVPSSPVGLAGADPEERVWRPTIFIEVTDAWWPSVSIRHDARRGGVVLAGPIEPLIECKPVV